MLKSKSYLVKRVEERHPSKGGILPFALYDADLGKVLNYQSVRDVSWSGIGFLMTEYLAPSMHILAEWGGVTFKFKVVHSTFNPDLAAFQCGLKILDANPQVDFVELMRSAGFIETETEE